jgi:capsular polysaccharide transport system permease protein
LREAGDEVVRAQIELTRFRNKELLINPEQSAAGNLEVISALSRELAQEQVRLQQMQMSSPSNPNIPALRERIRSLSQQIGIEKSKLTGSDEAISNKLSTYEELLLRRTLSEKSYETAIHSLDEARQEAARKQIYLEALVQPNLPDESRDPLRFRMVLTVGVLSLVVFVMTYLLVAGSREHLNLDE